MSRYEDNNRREGKRKKSSPVATFFTSLLLVIAIGVFGYAAFTLYGYYREYKAGTDEYGSLNDKYVNIVPGAGTDESGQEAQPESVAPGQVLTNVAELEDPATVSGKVEAAAKENAVEDNEEKSLPVLVNPINFDELNAINPDIMGWIRIGALDISYPVAQGTDNDYYLHRTFEGVDNFAGCIFLNCDNTRYLTDQNSIIYGHNMKNGSMFGTLREFANQETYDKNPYFWIFTPDFIYQYRIFSSSEVYKIGDPYRTRFTTEDFQAYIDQSLANSNIACSVEVTTEDRIVTLSTCTADDSTRRIVQGKLEQVYISAK